MVKKFDCKRTEDGAFNCKRVEQDKNGEERVIGEMTMRADGNCKPVIDASSGEDKAMAELHEHMTKGVNYSCTKKE